MARQTAAITSRVSLRLFISLSWCLVACALTDTKVNQLFVKQTLCPGKVVGLDQCPVSGSAGVMGGCSLQCAKRSDCLSFLWDRVQHVCHLCTRIVSNDCVTNTQDQMGLEAYEKICEQDTGKPAVNNRCLCPEYRIGELCQNTMTDCKDWCDDGFPDGVYSIRPSATKAAFRVKCSMQYKRTYLMVRRHRASNFYRGWNEYVPPAHYNRSEHSGNSNSHKRTYLMVRRHRASNFYRGWNEYVNGFGDPSGDHWIGLIHMSSLTNAMCYTLFIQANIGPGIFHQAWYNGFTVADASKNFSLGLHAYVTPTNHLGDCLSEVKGRPFSTYDADHDGDVSTNCAQRYESGWWMGTLSGTGCTLCNPTGRLLQPADMKRTNQDKEVFWTPLGDGTTVPNAIAMWVQRC